MTTDVSTLVVIGVTVVVAAAGGILPFSPMEPVLLGVAALGRPALLVPVVVLATASQMATKMLLFAGSRRVQGALSDRKRAIFDRVCNRLAGRRKAQTLTVFVSALAGLPPLYIVTVACGALGLSLKRYLIAGTAGRAIRFTALVTLPQLLATAPLLAQRTQYLNAVSVAGDGPQTYVLLSGMVGGVAGFRRLEARLHTQGHRVIIIDPYHLSVDSADVTFAALARSVEKVLAEHRVTGATMVGHAHGAGVMLRLAALAPQRVSELYFLDVGALAANRTKVLTASLRLVPVIARIPGGRAFIRDRYIRGLRENAGREDWLDADTQRAYTEPVLDGIDEVIAMAIRLGRATEPEPLDRVIARVRAPITVILGEVPHPSGPDSAELEALATLGAHVRVKRFAGVGHFPHEETPDDVAGLLLERPGDRTATVVTGVQTVLSEISARREQRPRNLRNP